MISKMRSRPTGLLDRKRACGSVRRSCQTIEGASEPPAVVDQDAAFADARHGHSGYRPTGERRADFGESRRGRVAKIASGSYSPPVSTILRRCRARRCRDPAAARIEGDGPHRGGADIDADQHGAVRQIHAADSSNSHVVADLSPGHPHGNGQVASPCPQRPARAVRLRAIRHFDNIASNGASAMSAAG